MRDNGPEAAGRGADAGDAGAAVAPGWEAGQPPSQGPTLVGCTVSDLHILTQRSAIHRYAEQLDAAARRASVFVFNGDIFDFRWSRAGSFRQSVQVALDWIADLVAHYPHCRFVFTIGNHDDVGAYREGLFDLSEQYANLDWARYWLRIGDKFFLHGDVVDRAGRPARLERARARWDREMVRGELANAVYGAAMMAGAHRLASRVLSRRRSARRILAYMRHVLGPSEWEIRDIYFGHIHSSFVDFWYRGRRFHNSGTAIRQLSLRVIEFPYRAEQLELCHEH